MTFYYENERKQEENEVMLIFLFYDDYFLINRKVNFGKGSLKFYNETEDNKKFENFQTKKGEKMWENLWFDKFKTLSLFWAFTFIKLVEQFSSKTAFRQFQKVKK